MKLSKESEAVQASGDSSEGVPSGVSHTADTVTAADTSSIADALTTPEVVSVADALSTAAEVFSAFV
ncbi:hypothetical protein [Bartonella bacilliformis]|uniref:Uncharacterized protein n=1 Tax=Bartonella bacilliformis (strain ATCC 35685 / KC583 / Herrer 020/F12,63) TaxID=360095 RepID=A1URF2_BARBK|nr:hypothetical protein [Bartonella bacilliformis]ABM44989.1 hypothetical protein BARBAKC583_0221 [Bartonella bacilliformis KC583]